MNNLIQITRSNINGSEVNSVDARELYFSLEIKTDFSTWIKRQLEIFIEDEDYVRLHKKVEANNATQIDYILTIDTAKHISMIQKNETGMKIRKYFIEVEKEKTPQLQLPSKIELAQMVIEAETKVLKLEKFIVEKDKVILAVADLNIRAGDVTIGDFSKNLAIEGLGQNNLFSWLKARGFLMMNTAPYQQYVQRGYFVRKPSDKKINGEVRYTTMLTPKGTIWLTKMLKAEFDLE